MYQARARTGELGLPMWQGMDYNAGLRVVEPGDNPQHRWGEIETGRKAASLFNVATGEFPATLAVVASRLMAEGAPASAFCSIVEYQEQRMRELHYNGKRYYSRSRRIYERVL